MRVVTLLPAATEIVAALDMLDHVVAVSHECDFPADVNAKPRATHCPIHESALPSAEVDRWVTARGAGVGAVRAGAAGARRRRCVVLEWIDPPFRSGHWTPELVEIAGGVEPLGRRGQDAARVSWEDVRAASPEVLVLACCGYRVERTLGDVPILRRQPGWDDLPAVRAGEVHAVDGSVYFSRPGPRIVDSLELLAEILHPERFRGRFPEHDAVRVAGDVQPLSRR